MTKVTTAHRAHSLTHTGTKQVYYPHATNIRQLLSPSFYVRLVVIGVVDGS